MWRDAGLGCLNLNLERGGLIIDLATCVERIESVACTVARLRPDQFTQRADISVPWRGAGAAHLAQLAIVLGALAHSFVNMNANSMLEGCFCSGHQRCIVGTYSRLSSVV